MNMIIEKNTKFDDKTCCSPEDFKKILEKEESDFLNNFDKNYSCKFIEEYSINIFNGDKYVPYFLPGNIFFFTILILFFEQVLPLNIFTAIFFILIFISAIGFHGLTMLKPVKKILNKHWLKNEENRNSIKKKIFMNNVVDKALLKLFSKTYGKNSLKKLLDENESVKYKNIISYIRNYDGIEENARKKEERSINLDEIVNCITSDHA